MSKILGEIEDRMLKAINVFKNDLSLLRTGRISISIFESLKIDCYGEHATVSQIGTLNVIDHNLITINVWDHRIVGHVEKSIQDLNQNFTVSINGNIISVRAPILTKERRLELVKVASKYSEQCKISIRNLRRYGMEDLRKQEKTGLLSKDEKYRIENMIQDLTDNFIKKINLILKNKESEILGI